MNGDKDVLVVKLSSFAKTVIARWTEIGMAGQVSVYDLWEHSNLGVNADSMVIENIPEHGCSFFGMSGRSVDIAALPRYNFWAALYGVRPGTALTAVMPAGCSCLPALEFDMRGHCASGEVLSAPGVRSTRVLPHVRIDDKSK